MDIDLWLRDWGQPPLTRHETILLTYHRQWSCKTCAEMTLKMRRGEFT
jgi:hypothetical protein